MLQGGGYSDEDISESEDIGSVEDFGKHKVCSELPVGGVCALPRMDRARPVPDAKAADTAGELFASEGVLHSLVLHEKLQPVRYNSWGG